MHKLMDVLTLCHKVMYKPWTVAEEQGHVAQCLYLWDGPGFTNISALWNDYIALMLNKCFSYIFKIK